MTTRDWIVSFSAFALWILLQPLLRVVGVTGLLGLLASLAGLAVIVAVTLYVVYRRTAPVRERIAEATSRGAVACAVTTTEASSPLDDTNLTRKPRPGILVADAAGVRVAPLAGRSVFDFSWDEIDSVEHGTRASRVHLDVVSGDATWRMVLVGPRFGLPLDLAATRAVAESVRAQRPEGPRGH